jgi:tetratricopeptide (TPR) repeat protein
VMFYRLLSSFFLGGLCASAVIAAPAPTTRPAEISERDRARASELARKAVTYMDQQRYAQADLALRDALAIIPDKTTWLFNLACVQAVRGKPDEAMDTLEQATDLGFTDFTQLEHDAFLKPLRGLPRYQKLIARKDEIRHNAAELALAQLKARLGPKYLYEADEQNKLIFAAATDQATLDALKSALLKQAASQWDLLFSHKPDEFIRIVIPTAVDFRKLVHVPSASGIYLDESRTLYAQRMGQVVVHEFTHALHAADQRAVGQEHPVWLREGLASMYEAGDFVDDVLEPRDNFRLAFVQNAARRHALVPLEKLLRYTPQDFVSHANLAYGQSSSLLLYLYEQKLIRKFYDEFKKTYDADPFGRIALERTTGLDLAELQNQWTQWMLQREAPALQPPLGGAWIGASVAPGNDGIRITLVSPNGPALMSGLKVGDVIIAVDEHEARDSQTLLPIIASHQPGDLIVLKVRRGEEYLKVPMVLGKR